MKIRIGNDVKMKWVILKNGLPYDLSGKDIIVQMIDATKRKVIIDYQIIDYTIDIVFRGKNQYEIGDYSLILIENRDENGMITVDYQKAFTLVRHSAEVDNVKSPENVIIEVPTFTSNITAQGGGGDIDLSDYYNKHEVDKKLSTKQDKLKSGENIKTINGENIIGSGNIVIESGKEGPQGPAGPAGADGKDGKDGADGAVGPQGPAGERGLQGEQGPAGERGLQGEQGPAGERGPIGETGPQGPAGADGKDAVVKEWIGTQSEYEALGTYDSETKYYIVEG